MVSALRFDRFLIQMCGIQFSSCSSQFKRPCAPCYGIYRLVLDDIDVVRFVLDEQSLEKLLNFAVCAFIFDSFETLHFVFTTFGVRIVATFVFAISLLRILP